MGYSRNKNNRGCSMWISLLSINSDNTGRKYSGERKTKDKN